MDFIEILLLKATAKQSADKLIATSRMERKSTLNTY